MSDWSIPVAELLVKTCKSNGITAYSEIPVRTVFDVLALRDKPKTDSNRIGFYYLSQQTVGLTKFFSKVKSLWPQVKDQPVTIQVATNETTFQYQCVASVKLDRNNYDVSQIHTLLKDYTIQNLDPPFDCLVIQAVHVHGFWYDLKLKYNGDILRFFKLMSSIPWIKDVRTRPFSDFGKIVPEYM